MARPKTLTIIPADPARAIEVRQGDEELSTLQAIVGGYIEGVPHWTAHNGQRCAVYCNESGRLSGLPLNERATALWLSVLGKGPFRYKPELFGDIVIVQSAAGAARAA